MHYNVKTNLFLDLSWAKQEIWERDYGKTNMAGIESMACFKYLSSLFSFFIIFISFLSFLKRNFITPFAIDREVDVFVEIRHDHKDKHHKGQQASKEEKLVCLEMKQKYPTDKTKY